MSSGPSTTRPTRDAARLLSLLNSTLSSAHELVRSLAVVQRPSPSLLRPIRRNLTTLAEGIVALQDEQAILEQEGRRSTVSLEEIRRKEDELVEVKGAWERLCEVLDKHEKTSEMLNDVRERHSSLFETIQGSGSIRSASLAPYHDEPANAGTNASTNKLDTSDIIQSQNQQMDLQDRHLDALSSSIGRQHHLSLQMNEELDTHATLLEEFDREVVNTGARLGRASRRLTQFTDSLKEHGSTWTIFALIVVLVLLIAVFK